eukprot:GHVQ01018016.1.p2 GENE.GHVQ01018016.1~~GHVQ01018016.1.p2  ORF type:complete len:208 (+),score=17.64 GHVQ01018016.1:831-1454(+)
MDLLNWISVIAWDIIIAYYCGWKTLFYFVGGTILSMGIHPLNGHLIAEHFQFPYGEQYQETYSYYGIGNAITYNAGYHVEHHDFPRVPGSRLPQLKKIANEFYDTIPHHNSWIRVVWDFISMDNVGCFSRVKRVGTAGGDPLPPHVKMHPGEKPNTGLFLGSVNNGISSEATDSKEDSSEHKKDFAVVNSAQRVRTTAETRRACRCS